MFSFNSKNMKLGVLRRETKWSNILQQNLRIVNGWSDIFCLWYIKNVVGYQVGCIAIRVAIQ